MAINSNRDSYLRLAIDPTRDNYVRSGIISTREPQFACYYGLKPLGYVELFNRGFTEAARYRYYDGPANGVLSW